MSTRKKRGAPRRRSGGSMMSMRGGFRGMFSGGKSKKRDPKQFVYLLLALLALGALVFFGTR